MKNLWHGGYQYGTNPRKIEPEYNPNPKTTQRQNTNKTKSKRRKLEIVKDVPRQEVKLTKEQKTKRTKLIITALGIFVVLLAISYQNSQITVKFNEVQKQKNELASLQKENEQLKVNIENSLNLSNIEKEAKVQLGMQKLTNKQTVYVSLPKKDYVEAAPEKVIIEEEESWFQKIVSKIFK